MSARFEVFKDVAGEFRFRLRAANGEIMMQSEGYATESNARRGVSDLLATVNASRGETIFVVGKDPPEQETK
jgi:uncharacterized protein YegP (UPF0339 family)